MPLPVSDSDIESVQSLCTPLGTSPRYNRKTFTIRPYMTHKEIGEELGISRQAVQFIERRALKKLRRMLQ